MIETCVQKISKSVNNMKQQYKTNVMRLLDGAKIEYKPYEYDPAIVDGETVAATLHENPAKTFKTLVTVSASKKNYVFVIPVAETLDLKKAAKTVGEKSVEMIKQKDLLPTTGYIHGGCSPIGMKKKFRTVFHETAADFDTVIFSAGKVGYQVEINTKTALEYIGAEFGNVTV